MEEGEKLFLEDNIKHFLRKWLVCQDRAEWFLPSQAESSNPTEGPLQNESKSRFRVAQSPRQKRETLLSQPLAASHKPATLSARQRQGILGRDECRISRAVGTPQTKPKNTAGRNHHCWMVFRNLGKRVDLKCKLPLTVGDNLLTRNTLWSAFG